jgi:hypothetical protein
VATEDPTHIDIKTYSHSYTPTHTHTQPTHTYTQQKKRRFKCLLPSLCKGRWAHCLACEAVQKQALLLWAAVALQQAQASQVPEAGESSAADTTLSHTRPHPDPQLFPDSPPPYNSNHLADAREGAPRDDASAGYRIAESEPISLSGGLPSTRHVGIAHSRQVRNRAMCTMLKNAWEIGRRKPQMS